MSVLSIERGVWRMRGLPYFTLGKVTCLFAAHHSDLYLYVPELELGLAGDFDNHPAVFKRYRTKW